MITLKSHTNRQLSRRPRWGGCAWICLLITCMAGCGGGSADFGPRAAVKGKVTLDGEPVPLARIVFINDSTANVAVKATALIQDGVYEIDEGRGPLIGKNKVKIESEQIELEHFEQKRGDDKTAVPEFNAFLIPPQYRRPMLKAEVEEVGENQFDYQLVTRK